MKKFIFPMLFIFSSCTFAVNQIHTEGTASDVLKEDQTSDPNIDPNLTIPMHLSSSY